MFHNFRTFRCGLLSLALLLAFAACARAQPGRRSARGTVTQTVGGAEVSVRYYRPSLRGRTPFPDVVRWDHVWTPGADSATRIETTAPLDVDGASLPAGRYSLWLIPREHAKWTVIFNRDAALFHLAYPEANDALRVDVAPATTPTVETLTIAFPAVDADSATMTIQWGATALSLHLRARP